MHRLLHDLARAPCTLSPSIYLVGHRLTLATRVAGPPDSRYVHMRGETLVHFVWRRGPDQPCRAREEDRSLRHGLSAPRARARQGVQALLVRASLGALILCICVSNQGICTRSTKTKTPTSSRAPSQARRVRLPPGITVSSPDDAAGKPSTFSIACSVFHSCRLRETLPAAQTQDAALPDPPP